MFPYHDHMYMLCKLYNKTLHTKLFAIKIFTLVFIIQNMCKFIFLPYSFVIMLWKCMQTAPPSVFRIVSIGTCSFALLFEAEWVEWGVNNFTSISAAASVVFIHRVSMPFDIGLYCFNVVINSKVKLSLLSFVASRYFIRKQSWHMFLFVGNVGILLLQYDVSYVWF